MGQASSKGDFMKVKDWDFKLGCFGGGITLYPYQLALGITFRYWPCIFAPNIRIHVGPFKLWFYIVLKSKDKGEK